MSNQEESGRSNHDVDEMDYEGEHNYLDYLAGKGSQGLQDGLGDGADANIDTNGTGTDTDGGAETGGEGPSAEAANQQKKPLTQLRLLPLPLPLPLLHPLIAARPLSLAR
jgi:hypothetical protein